MNPFNGISFYNWRQDVLDTALPWMAKYTALYLAAVMHERIDIPGPGLSVMAKGMGLSKPTVVKSIKVLLESKYLIRTGKNARGRESSSIRYIPTTPELWEQSVKASRTLDNPAP